MFEKAQGASVVLTQVLMFADCVFMGLGRDSLQSKAVFIDLPKSRRTVLFSRKLGSSYISVSAQD